jgi:hypothetical protein
MTEEKREGFELMKAEDRALALASEDSAFLNVAKFEQVQRAASMLAKSDFVPAQFQGKIGNCMIALDLADRMRMHPLMLMQTMYVVHGRPGFEGKFASALINNSGRYMDPLEYEWQSAQNKPDWGCRAWAIRKSTEKKITGPWVTWAMVQAEGWNKKPGSKWLTMPEIMFMYRAASFFAKTNDSDLMMGMQTLEELEDEGLTLVKSPTGEYTTGEDKPKDLYNVTRKAPEAPTDTGQPEDDKGGETPSDAANTTTADPAGPLPGQGDFEDEKLENRNTNPLPDSGGNKSYPWDTWNPLDSPRQKRYSATLKGIMLAFLAHHGIDANPHDTGLQLHDQILKECRTELGTGQYTEPDPDPEPEEKQEPETYAQMPEAQIKMVERMNELIISGNASAKSYAAQMLNLGTRRPTPDEAEAWLACYDDAMADLAQKSEGQDPFSGQF